MATEVGCCNEPIFFVLGATGSGKSLAAVKVAQTLQHHSGYERVIVVNCDVMQFYADLPIATNKISSAEMEGIPHFFMGFLSPKGVKIRDPTVAYKGCDREKCGATAERGKQELYNVHSYVRDAVDFIRNFFQENPFGAVVVCGGTCYYAQALMFDNVLTEEDLDDSLFPDSSVASSSCVENREGDGLWKELAQVDPVVAVRYHPNDKRRISRLIEIYKKTGRPPSEIYATRPSPCFRFSPARCFVLWPCVTFEKLRTMLDKRVDKMVERGIVQEFIEFAQTQVKSDLDVGLAKAIGFKEFLPAFDVINGEFRLKEDVELKKSIELLKTNTKRYARQQIQWIKNRFLGQLRDVFTSTQGTRQFVCVDASNTESEFIETVESATKLLVTFNLQQGKNLTFPLNQIREPLVSVKQEWCHLCEMFVCGGEKMRLHLASKRHRGAVKHVALVKEQQEKYGRVIPPKRRRLS
ncbi:putative tRNA isopentenyltransferase [Trypanosoma grayi]|uniref:putative tRNA isopentenyltransferase n=1 Tax=Trypanosoma grayi TaxID=71804 RepID=UPI0004F475D9|nr:putative tRNA isopentenyltransferase [Trypanosoma grayi]KEG14421.1 putative tRNA isopentenyltransferase [Trypanosoma grayi]